MSRVGRLALLAWAAGCSSLGGLRRRSSARQAPSPPARPDAPATTTRRPRPRPSTVDDEHRRVASSSSPATAGATASASASGAPTATRSTAGRTTGSSPTTTRARRSARRRSRPCACCSPPAKKVTLDSTSPGRSPMRPARRSTLDPGSSRSKPKLAIAGTPALQPPLTFTAKQPLVVDGNAYRGKLTVSSDGKLVQVVDTVGLEPYLKGVVPSEMPSTWPPEALKAQAVAARSYALANLTKGRAFDLYGDTRSQVYGGVDAEAAATSAAVDATKGQVVLYNGKVANTLFFSTSGGRTASGARGDRGRRPVPRLGRRSLRHALAVPRLGAGALRRDEGREAAEARRRRSPTCRRRRARRAASRRVTIVSDDDSQVTLTGKQLRGALELRSTWFTPALLQLLPAAKTMTYGGARLARRASRAAQTRVSLEAKPPALDWTPAGDAAARRGRRVLDDREAAGRDAVPARLGRRARRAREDRRRAARRRAGRRRRACRGRSSPRVAGRGGAAAAAGGAPAWTTVASTSTDSDGRLELRRAACSPAPIASACAPGPRARAGRVGPILVQ